MRHIVDPRQEVFFSEFDLVFSPLGRRTVEQGWQGVFRHIVLELMPADILAGHFDPILGQPTKELYSMAGLVFIAEFYGWTAQEAADNYMFRNDLHYALNLVPVGQSMSSRTVERYRRLFRKSALALDVFDRVTGRFIDLLELDVHHQRVDSTHVLSDMATFGRTRQMAVAIRRFLVQVKRHQPDEYAALPEHWQQRYAPGEHQLLQDAKDAAARQRCRQQVAQDLYELVERFAADPACQGRTSYQALVRMLHEQCDVAEGTVTVKKNPGGQCLQNPSDPDATYDGNKGAGYKVQLAETCSPANEVQLVTCAIPQTAADQDADATATVLHHLEQTQRMPEQVLADASYCSDENVRLAETKGVELVGPVPGSAKVEHGLCLDDFAVDERTGQVERCPAGNEPTRCHHDVEKDLFIVDMPTAACEGCSFRSECPIEQAPSGRYYLRYPDVQRRSQARRREEDTAAFRQRYAPRAGIESTNSGLKRKVGLKRLRVRGRGSVFQSIYLKVAGWNLLRAARGTKVRAWMAKRLAQSKRSALRGPFSTSSEHYPWLGHALGSLPRLFTKDSEHFHARPLFGVAI